ncbi:MAG TPA: SDR family oxidoreductase [Acidimicrobiales bacterium]|jgi:NAD(P)-dependent dehydrogenase (short-subunit alcohol dehydrogenase family)|nr:SDR family oxidoreductase [Acidimicrobiales bacterium]
MTNTTIITGGSRGLGRALAADLAADGWHVIIDGRDVAAVHAAAEAIGAHAVPGDVSDPVHRRALVAAAQATGRLDLLVNNASTLGASPLPRLSSVPLDMLEHVYLVNVVAPLGLVQLARPLLLQSGGAVLDITSDAAVEGYEGWGAYGSSKAALDQLGNVLAAEEPDLRVWSFDPGDMRTRMHQDAFPGEDISDRPEPETVVPAIRALLRKRPPSGRVRAADITAELLAGDRA